MSEGFGEKVKTWFGFGDVDSYSDPYYRDSFKEERDPRDEGRDVRDRDARDVRESRVAAHDREDRYSRRSDAGYRGYSAGRESDYSAPRRSATPPIAEKEPQVVRQSLGSYTEASDLVEVIKAGDVAVFNLGGLEKGEATRVLDFAAGLARGVDAELKKLGGVRNFVLVPAGLTLEQSQLDQLVEDL